MLLIALITLAIPSPGSTTIYVTKSGKRYHRFGCPYLRGGGIAKTLQDAHLLGLTPCAHCRPPELGADPPERAPNPPERLPNPPERAPNPPERLPNPPERLPNPPERLPNPPERAAGPTRFIEASFEGERSQDTIVVCIANPPPGLQARETVRLAGVQWAGGDRIDGEAGALISNRLLGHRVTLQLAPDTRDRDGKLLAYVFAGPGDCLNADLIRFGFVTVTTGDRHPRQSHFEELEMEAKRNRVGIWGP